MENFALLIQTLFNAYLVIIWLRILLPKVHASYHHPLSQIIIKLTNPLLKPMRKVIPGHKHIDVAALILLIIVAFVKIYSYYWLASHITINFIDALIMMVGDVLGLLLMILFWSIIIQSVVSWIATPHRSYGHLQTILFHLTHWMLKPMRRLIPPIGQVDLSPIPVLLILYILYRLLNYYTVGFINV